MFRQETIEVLHKNFAPRKLAKLVSFWDMCTCTLILRNLYVCSLQCCAIPHLIIRILSFLEFTGSPVKEPYSH